MKVFRYNTDTGQREEQVDSIRVPCYLANPKMASCVMPKYIPVDTEWSVSTVCRDFNNELVLYPYPVCFCLGQMKAGEGESFWDWKILLTSI